MPQQYNDILDNGVLPTLWQQFGEDPFLFLNDNDKLLLYILYILLIMKIFTILGEQIEQVQIYKHLTILIDHQLSFKLHTD